MENGNGNGFNPAHPMENTGSPKEPGGFFQKIIKFAQENPFVTVMGALVALGILLPGDKKKSW
jgi:hypothetical protein